MNAAELVASVVEAAVGSMSPPDVLAMRADFCLWFLCGRASVLKKRQPAGPAAAAAKKDSRRITSMADLAAFTGKASPR